MPGCVSVHKIRDTDVPVKANRGTEVDYNHAMGKAAKLIKCHPSVKKPTPTQITQDQSMTTDIMQL